MLQRMILGLIVMGLAAVPGTAHAQSLFGNTGALSQSGGAPGSTGVGPTGSGGPGSSLGGQSGGLGAAGQGPTLNQLGDVSSQVGSGGFAGAVDTSQGFIGQRQAQGATGQGGRGGGANFAGLQAGGGRGGQGGGRGQTPQSTQRTAAERYALLRPQLKVGFRYEPAPASEVQSSLVQRIQRIPVDSLIDAPIAQSSVQVSLDGEGIATLTGTIESESARRLAETVTRLQPGVRSVVNELVVSGK